MQGLQHWTHQSVDQLSARTGSRGGACLCNSKSRHAKKNSSSISNFWAVSLSLRTLKRIFFNTKHTFGFLELSEVLCQSNLTIHHRGFEQKQTIICLLIIIEEGKVTSMMLGLHLLVTLLPFQLTLRPRTITVSHITRCPSRVHLLPSL